MPTALDRDPAVGASARLGNCSKGRFPGESFVWNARSFLMHQCDGVGAKLIAKGLEVHRIDFSGFEVVVEVMDGLVENFALESESGSCGWCACFTIAPKRQDEKGGCQGREPKGCPAGTCLGYGLSLNGFEHDRHLLVGIDPISLAVEVEASALLERAFSMEALALDNDAVIGNEDVQQVHWTFELNVQFRSSLHGNSVAIADD